EATWAPKTKTNNVEKKFRNDMNHLPKFHSQGSRTISPLFSFGRLPYCYGAGQQGSSGYSSAKRVLFRRFGGSFLSTRATERVEHSVISLVAAVLEKLIAGFLRNRKSDLPRSGIDLRIVNRHLVLDCIAVYACETFHRPKGFAGGNATAVPSDTGLLVEEIRCLDHQRVASSVIEFLLTASKKKPATSGLWIRSPSVRIRCEASLWLRSTRKSIQPSLRPTDIQKFCRLLRMTRSFQAAAD